MTDKPAESAVERVIGFAYARGLDPWVFDMRDATSHRLDELYVFGDLGELAELSVLSLRINCIIWASEASRIREVKRQRDAALAELKTNLAAAEERVRELEKENRRLKGALVEVYRSPLLDESRYHERGEGIPRDVWDACEVIREAMHEGMTVARLRLTAEPEAKE